MDDVLATAFRDTFAGSLRAQDIGREVQLAGWVHRSRDLGGLVFFDLRDRAGLVQISFDPAWTPPDVLARARGLAAEDVVQVRGTIAERIKKNPQLPSGEIELRGTALTVLSTAEPLPIQVDYAADEELPGEDLRLRYRYLDLRRAELQRNFLLRHRAGGAVRAYLTEHGFWEVETPMLTKPTPEGARDFLVPSRVHPGEFYSLPQSPQLYKQLLMVSGFDRYFQIARCLRDEDLRADRQPEFTQVDAEMAFATEEDVFRVGEGLMAALWREVLGVELETPFVRLTYDDAMLRYGTDKPDLRYGLEIRDLTAILQDADFRVFQAVRGTSQRIRGLRVPGGGALSRKQLDELQDVARRGNAVGALWVKRTADGFAGSFGKALTGSVGNAFLAATDLQPGDLWVGVVGNFRVWAEPGSARAAAAQMPTPVDAPAPFLEAALDELRRHLARLLDLVPSGSHAWAWVTDFPLFDWDADAERLVAAHHPFTMPHPDDVPALLALTEGEGPLPAEPMRALFLQPVRSRAYDAVYNGNELASGSVRIHQPDLQRRVFRALGIGADEAREKFGFLLEAFRYGAPPHAGFAFGFDRLVMLLAGATSLREVIAFPKTASARALFEGAPSPVNAADLAELHVATVTG